VLFNEPKLLKSRFSLTFSDGSNRVSVLFNEPKLLKLRDGRLEYGSDDVSVLFNEPKLLKFHIAPTRRLRQRSFSALQRAEIAEMFAFGSYAVERLWFQCSSTSRNC